MYVDIILRFISCSFPNHLTNHLGIGIGLGMRLWQHEGTQSPQGEPSQ